MTSRVFTSPLRRKTLWLLATEHGYNERELADAMCMSPDKIAALLQECLADETACDQVRALAGPFLLGSVASDDHSPGSVASDDRMASLPNSLTGHFSSPGIDDRFTPPTFPKTGSFDGGG